MSVLPGPIRQIGYVVTDLDRAIASWVELGVGPWLVIRGLPMRALYRGEPCETTLSLALSNSGELQIELIQQQDDTPSIFTEFLAANGPGYHQLAYWAEDFDATMKAVEDAGWPVVWSGGEGFGVRFAYVEPPNRPAGLLRSSRSPNSRMGRWPARSSSETPRRIGTAVTRSATSVDSASKLYSGRPVLGAFAAGIPFRRLATCRASSPCPRRPNVRRPPTTARRPRRPPWWRPPS